MLYIRIIVLGQSSYIYKFFQQNNQQKKYEDCILLHITVYILLYITCNYNVNMII